MKDIEEKEETRRRRWRKRKKEEKKSRERDGRELNMDFGVSEVGSVEEGKSKGGHER